MKQIKYWQTILTSCLVSFLLVSVNGIASAKNRSSDILAVGKPLPNAKLKAHENLNVDIKDLKGKIKIISIVPKLNTPVCDKQTHRFSETNGGLDKFIDIITLSTNSTEDQHEFAEKAKIHNLIFLSDNPEFLFGKNSGLLIEGLKVLRRTVLVADQDNIIRYVDFVPGGGLPNIEKALNAANELLQASRSKS
tara:strand:- start:28 stop:606 length:579 start_codon:yes stop_codon:yes gene_type:complete